MRKIINKVLLVTLSCVALLGLAVGCTNTENTTTTPTPPANPEVLLASTTSTRDSGLFDVLVPKFEEETGYIVKGV
jgi:tungstate transport system substrate-binding protein